MQSTYSQLTSVTTVCNFWRPVHVRAHYLALLYMQMSNQQKQNVLIQQTYIQTLQHVSHKCQYLYIYVHAKQRNLAPKDMSLINMGHF